MNYRFALKSFLILSIGFKIYAQDILWKKGLTTFSAVSIEGKLMGMQPWNNSQTRNKGIAVDSDTGNLYWEHIIDKRFSGSAVVGYNGRFFYTDSGDRSTNYGSREGETGGIYGYEEGFFSGSGKSSPTEFLRINLSDVIFNGFAISATNKGYWGENNILKCADLSYTDSSGTEPKTLWEKSLNGAVTTAPIVLSDNKIIVATDPSYLCAIDGNSGDVIWEKDISFSFQTDENAEIIAGYKGFLHITNQNNILTINTNDGSVSWEYSHDQDVVIRSPRVTSNGKLLYITNKEWTSEMIENVGGITCLDLKTQSISWEKRHDFAFFDLAIGDENNIYATTTNIKTNLLCIDLIQGTEKWEYEDIANRTGPIWLDILDSNGRLVLNEYVFQTTSTGLDEGPWPIRDQSVYRRRQASSLELSSVTSGNTTPTNPTTPTSPLIDPSKLNETWAYLVWPWVYIHGLNTWVYYYSSGSDHYVWVNSDQKWYSWDSQQSHWTAQD